MKTARLPIKGLTLNLTDYSLPFRTTRLSLWPEKLGGWRSHPGFYRYSRPLPDDLYYIDATGTYTALSFGVLTVGDLDRGISYSENGLYLGDEGVHIPGLGYYIAPDRHILLARDGSAIPRTSISPTTPKRIAGNLTAGEYLLEFVTIRSAAGGDVVTGAVRVQAIVNDNDGLELSVNADALDDNSRVHVYVRRRSSSSPPFSSAYFLAALTKEKPTFNYTDHLQEQEFFDYRTTLAYSEPAAFFSGRWFYQATKLTAPRGGLVDLPNDPGPSAPYVFVYNNGDLSPVVPTPPAPSAFYLPQKAGGCDTYGMYIPGVGSLMAFFSNTSAGDMLQIWLGGGDFRTPNVFRLVAQFTGSDAQRIVQGAYNDRAIVLVGERGRVYSAKRQDVSTWTIFDAGNPLSRVIGTPTAFIVAGDGPNPTGAPYVAVSNADGENWVPAVLPPVPDSAQQLATTLKGAVWHDNYVYLLTHSIGSGRMNVFRAQGPAFNSWQYMGGSGGDDDWWGWIGLVHYGGPPASRAAVIGFHDGWDGIMQYIRGNVLRTLRPDLMDFDNLFAVTPDPGLNADDRIFTSSIANSAGNAFFVTASNKSRFYRMSGTLSPNVVNLTQTISLSSPTYPFISGDYSLLILGAAGTNITQVYNPQSGGSPLATWQQPLRFYLPGQPYVRRYGIPVWGGFLTSLGQAVTWGPPSQITPLYLTPHLRIGISSWMPLPFIHANQLVYSTDGVTIDALTSAINSLPDPPSVEFTDQYTVVLYSDAGTPKLLVASSSGVATHTAPTGAKAVVRIANNFYIATDDTLYTLDLTTGATSSLYTFPGPRLFGSGRNRLLAIDGTSLNEVTIAGSMVTETPLFTLPVTLNHLASTYDDGSTVAVLGGTGAGPRGFVWDGTTVHDVGAPLYLVTFDTSAPTGGGSQPKGDPNLPSDITLPSNTIIWTLPGYINLTTPASYYTFNFQTSTRITAIAQHPAGVIVFGENEAYIMTGRFTSIQDTRVYPFPAPIGCDPDTQPAYRGSEIYVIWKGRIYAVSLQDAQRISHLVDEEGDPFVQIAYDKRFDHLLARKRSGRTLRFSFLTQAWFDDGQWDAVYSGPSEALYLDHDRTPYTAASLTEPYATNDAFYLPQPSQLILEAIIPEDATPETTRLIRSIGLEARTMGPSTIQINLYSESGNLLAGGQLTPYSTGSPDGLSRWHILLPPYFADTIARAEFSFSTFVTDLAQVHYGYVERKRRV